MPSRPRRFLPCFAVAALFALTSTAHADARSDAKNGIQKAYNTLNAAVARKDLNGVMAHRDPNYVFISAKGEQKNAQQARAATEALLRVARSARIKSTVQNVTLRKGGAVVSVKENARFVLVVPPRRSARQGTLQLTQPTAAKQVMVVNNTAREFWVKQGGRWRTKQSRTLSTKVTVNGKPVPV